MASRGPTGEHRILQVHPTRHCNLRCLHCYSSSGPEQREGIAPEVLKATILDAAEEGYGVAGFSGGEPLLYPHLYDALQTARTAGMVTTVTSNGMLLTDRALASLQGVTSLLAISLDGRPEAHDRMRNSDRAFDTMVGRLDGVRSSGIPFGFIFTLTQHNVDELQWVAMFAISQGARLLQIHPLEMAGRAGLLLPEARPDETELSFALAEAVRIQELAGTRLRVQLDVAGKASIAANPDRVFAGADALSTDVPLADLVSPLVLEPDGTLVPLSYGFPRAYQLGNVNERSLRSLGSDWRRERLDAFQRLCQRTLVALQEPANPELLNWYEAISAVATDMDGIPRAPSKGVGNGATAPAQHGGWP